jgi:hypothetical protein
VPESESDLGRKEFIIQSVETEHCIISYPKIYIGYLPSMIQAAEDSYIRVTTDLEYDMKERKLPIYFLSGMHFVRFWRKFIRDGVDVYPENVILINMETAYFKDWDLTDDVSHELVHFVVTEIQRTWIKSTGVLKIGFEKIISHPFYEALAQTEAQQNNFQQCFMKYKSIGNYLKLNQIDTISIEEKPKESEKPAICEMHSLIHFLRKKYGNQIIPTIVHSVGELSFSKALEKYSAIPVDSLQIEWFDYMKNYPDNSSSQQ